MGKRGGVNFSEVREEMAGILHGLDLKVQIGRNCKGVPA